MDYQYSNLPFGIAATNILDDNDGLGTHPLSEAEKEDLIFKYKDADSQAKKDRIKNALSGDEDFRNLFNGPSIG